jgi:tetratricopeptide (TPR) repeat protein
MRIAAIALAVSALAQPLAEIESARDRQDPAALEKLAARAAAVAQRFASDAAANYRAAIAYSYVAEAAEQLHDRAAVKRAAEAGITVAERAAALKPDVSEHHRILGTLYGQLTPVDPVAGIGYARKAREALERAIQLDPKSARAYLSRGVGNYYLPAAFGGGVERALADFRKAIELDPKSADAHLWLGLALRKANRGAEARAALMKARELNPARVWIRQQLEKTQ